MLPSHSFDMGYAYMQTFPSDVELWTYIVWSVLPKALRLWLPRVSYSFTANIYLDWLPLKAKSLPMQVSSADVIYLCFERSRQQV